jgi:hypothetical protein
VVANPFVMGHFNTLYYRRALVSVRAMVDPNNDDDSLLTLLTDIAAHPADLEVTDSEMRLPGAGAASRSRGTGNHDRLAVLPAPLPLSPHGWSRTRPGRTRIARM